MKAGPAVTLIVFSVVVSAAWIYYTYNSNVPKTSSSSNPVMYSIQDIIKEKTNDSINS